MTPILQRSSVLRVLRECSPSMRPWMRLSRPSKKAVQRTRTRTDIRQDGGSSEGLSQWLGLATSFVSFANMPPDGYLTVLVPEVADSVPAPFSEDNSKVRSCLLYTSPS